MAKDDDKTRMYEIKQPKNVEEKGRKKKNMKYLLVIQMKLQKQHLL